MTVHGWIRWVEGLLEPSEHFKVALAVFIAIAFVCSIKTIVENVNHPKGGRRGKSVRHRKVIYVNNARKTLALLLLDIAGTGHSNPLQLCRRKRS